MDKMNYALTDRQRLQIEDAHSIVEMYGQYDQTAGADGAHYATAEQNPFKSQGLMCQNCVFYEGPRACELVSGEIMPEAVCKLWVIPDALVTASNPTKGETMHLTFSAPITAANAETRTITGQIVPFGSVGNTSAGPVVFEYGSLQIPDRVKVLEEHNATKPAGFLVGHQVTATGIIGELKISNTSRGNDLLVEASDGLRDGISVGANIIESSIVDGVIHITSAQLVEVSLVTNPAFAEARVSKVAASEDAETETSTQPVEEIDTMSETPIEEIAVEVEASKVEASSHTPIFTSPRVNLDMTAGQLLSHQLRAMNGDHASRETVTAALAVNDTAGDAGLIPVRYMREVVGVVDNSRPTIDAISRGALPDAGLTFKIPVWNTLPSVALTAEGVQPSSTQTDITSIDVDVVKFAGANIITWEDLDRSDPAYLDEYLRALAAKMAQAQNAYAYAAIADASHSSTGATLWGAVAQASSDSFAARRLQADTLITSPAEWGSLLGAVDGTGRPLYSASNPVNNGGNVRNVQGDFMGLGLTVDPAAGATDLIVMRNDAATWYESGNVQVRANVVSGGAVEIGLYSYGALAVKYGDSIRVGIID